MKTSMIISIAIAAIFTFASTNEVYISPVTGKAFDPNGKVTLEQVKARDERVLKKTGGFINVPAKGPLLTVVDMRDKEGASTKEFARVYEMATKLKARTVHTPLGTNNCPISFAREQFKANDALLVVATVDLDNEIPALSVYPEERIGIVNAAKLKQGKDPTSYEVRVNKELWRAIGFIMGLGFSPADNDMMQPYYTIEEIDSTIHAYIQPMNMLRASKFYDRFGVTKPRRVPYRLAVKEGWAPAPTNDVQQAVWDSVKNGTPSARANGGAMTNTPAK